LILAPCVPVVQRDLALTRQFLGELESLSIPFHGHSTPHKKPVLRRSTTNVRDWHRWQFDDLRRKKEPCAIGQAAFLRGTVSGRLLERADDDALRANWPGNNSA
jgi:hypothetical protein